MRRKLEFIVYAVIILQFIFRYAQTDQPERRPISPERAPAGDSAIILPEGSALPRDIAPQVNVDVERKAGNAVGTAFAVTDSGVFVTARHVVDGCGTVYLVRADRQLVEVQEVRSLSSADFAVVKVDGMEAAPFVLADTPPSRGIEGFMTGFPQGDPADVRATVIGKTTMRSSGRYRTKEQVIAWVERERRPGFAGALGGISGGPVFDGDGFVVGTVVAGAPRRGRVYTTHPRVFDALGNIVVGGERRTPTFNTDNFERTGKHLRRTHGVVQVYCKV